MTTSPLQDPLLLAVDEAVRPGEGAHGPQKGYLFFLGLAGIGAAMAYLVPAVLTMSIKATAIDSEHATTILSISIGIAAVFSLIAGPIFGQLSDRSTSRFGRRRPFLALGAALMAVGAVVMLAASSTLVLTISAIITMVGFAATMTAVTATIPDLLAPHKRGPASAIVGLSLPLGAVIGLFIAQAVSSHLSLQILIPAAIGALGSLVFAAVLNDRVATGGHLPPFSVRDILATYWVSPRNHPSFAWAWGSRFLIFFGVAAVQAYQAFYLIKVLDFTPKTVAGAVFVSTLVLTAFALLLAPIAGKISDRIGRRKPFVIAAALIFGVGLVEVANAHSFPMFLVGMGIVGIGQGIYMAVDLSLVTQILPDPENPAKDLAIINLANTLPSSIVPALAPAILAIGASSASPQNFPALFITGAIAGLIGAALILGIRKTR
jgi:MFS family permease